MVKKLLIFLAIGLFVAALTLPHSPLFNSSVGIDQGVYLYVGNAILDGKIPYKEAWDHKQPLTYFIYALSSLITNRTLWAVWLIEFVDLLTTGMLSFALLSKFCSKAISLAIVFVSLFSVWLLSGYGTPEQLALPFSMASLFLFYELLSPGVKPARGNILGLSIGILFACDFFLKQSLVAVPIAIVSYYALYIIVHREWKKLIHFCYMLLGFGFVTLIILGYLFVNHALVDYWDAAFIFNFVYSSTGLLEKLRSIMDQLKSISAAPALFMAFGLWIGALGIVGAMQISWVVSVLRRRHFSLVSIFGGAAIILLLLLRKVLLRDTQIGILEVTGLVIGAAFIGIGLVKKYVPGFLPSLGRQGNSPVITYLQERSAIFHGLISIAVILFPVVLVLNSFSGQQYDYYKISLFPALVLLQGGVVVLVLSAVEKLKLSSLYMVFFAGMWLASIYMPLLSLVAQYGATPDPDYAAATAYIKQSTLPTDDIYVWGTDTSIYTSAVYALAGRSSPTRYFYQLGPVAWKEYAARFSVVQEITQALQDSKPVFFILSDDTKLGNTTAECLQAAEKMDGERPVFEFLCSHYQLDRHIGHLQFYRLIP